MEINLQTAEDKLLMKRTCSAYIWTRVLDTPFWGIFNLLPFILYKSLNATPFQLAMIVTLKPLVSLLSSYWSHKVSSAPQRLASSIILARWIAFLPFFAFPFIQSAWYIIACFGIFMFLQVGMMPAWMELLKQNAPQVVREKVFSYAQAFGYLGGGLLPFLLGWILDHWVDAWRWMFIAAAIIALCAHFWLKHILLRPISPTSSDTQPSHPLFQPWKEAWLLLRKRPDFAKFQMAFMLLGSGLMIIQPALPVFFVDQLKLSFTEIGSAITLCKGISFACSSPLWVRWVQKTNLFHFGAFIAALATLFPLLLFAAQIQITWLFIAYLLYGFMQAGNELCWNMSGPIFAQHENSVPYSSINIIAVGIRGMFIPSLGALLLAQLGAFAVIIAACILCLLAAYQMLVYERASIKTEAIATHGYH